ncbi:PTS mannose/fructose/sorbose/N-acetylgalactosamine transporter subunit IIC [Amphibacillus sp. Q70]|uniref:PTS mannose/fructose/sorbose/N-acetylgalactosamine transporter subunit IIC n=1 Tax=Amphibacillus sp. Q70 TaxID=3453416 RepID=UPI003F825365
MILNALAIGFTMFLGNLSDTALGDPMLRRPLVMSSIVGLLLGDLQTGVIIGATLEVVFLGMTQIGGALPSDTMTGSIFGAAFAILTDQGTEVALTLAVPISMLAVFINQIILFLRGTLIVRFNSYIDKGEFKKFERLHLTSTFGVPVIYGLIGFIGIMLGTNAIERLVSSLPDVVMNGLTITGQLLPALGLALLLNMLWDKKLSFFLLLGFVLSAYLELPLIAIAIIGAVIAIHSGLKDKKISDLAKSNTIKPATDLEDDFFDD